MMQVLSEIYKLARKMLDDLEMLAYGHFDAIESPALKADKAQVSKY